MTIFNWKIEFPDQVYDAAGETSPFVTPNKQTRIGRLACDDSLGTVTTAGYLNQLVAPSNGQSGLLGQGYVPFPQDFWLIYYNGGSGLFSVSISAGVITLGLILGQGGVSGATVVGNLPDFSGTAGQMVDSGIAANKLAVYPFASSDPALDLVRFDVACDQAALATGGTVTLLASSGSKQFKLLNLWTNRGGTNFSGGGGDRLLSITDGTTAYSVIPATNLQTLVNAGWGMSTPLPFPASAAINTSTAAGAPLLAEYSGGTTDYTAGSIVISGLAQRVA